MRIEHAYIPYGAYWSTPFCRWQGSFANLHAFRFAADVAKRAMAERELDPGTLDAFFLGTTVPALSSFYGGPWLAGMIGAGGISGTIISQACATGARVIASAAYEVEIGEKQGIEPIILGLTADRTSNGPHLVYPNPHAPGARPDSEDWVWDNFGHDPFAKNAMIETAENVAKEENITTEAQHEVVLMRHEQYQAALADDSAFLKRFMPLPIEINPTGRKVIGEVAGDEGVFPTTAEGLERLKPVLPGGTVTYGGQTFPADGNAGVIVTSKEKAAKLSRDPKIEVQILAYAEGRAKKGFMPQANLPAAKQVLEFAGLKVEDLKAIKSHNPFAVNEICLSKGMGIPLEKMNNYGSSLIWGHPQGPTGMRLAIELIEELVIQGGGYGLFTGCAAGDTAASLVVHVRDAS